MQPYYIVDKSSKDPNNINPKEDLKWRVTIAGGNVFRLPTETEWEFACRAGTTTVYYWGNEINGNYCWYKDNSGNTIHPVGQKKPNAWGLYDMIGNARVWCLDWFTEEYYSEGPGKDPQGPESGSVHVIRGCGYNSGSYSLRSASRNWHPQLRKAYGLGIRVVRSGL